MEEKNNNNLNAKDLINVGIFTAFYIVVFWIVGMIAALPFLYPVMLFASPVASGIPFMLFITRVKKPGMVFIMSILVALFWFLMGYTWLPLVTFFISGILSELIFKAANYSGFKKIMIGFGVFSLGNLGLQLPLWILADTYVAEIKASYGKELVNQLLHYMPWWMGIVEIFLLFSEALLGALLGRKMLGKHFERAGIA